MMDDLETRLRAAFRDRAADAPRDLRRALPESTPSSRGIWPNSLRGRGTVAAVAAVLATVAAVLVFAPQLFDATDRPAGWSSHGITLNTSSWEPGDDANQALIVSVVRVDENGCVYLRRNGVRIGIDVIWPAGYTATRRPDGTVIISNPDGQVVAATGQRLRAGGGEAAADTEFACRAQGPTTSHAFTIQRDLPPLND